MLIKRPADIRSSEITDEKLYHNRREFMRAAGIAAGAAAGAGVFWGAESTLSAAEPAPHGRKLEGVKPSELSVTGEKANSWEQITTYNNFYEFGTDKEDPALYAKSLRTEPWSVVVDGEVAKPAKYALEDILKGQTLEERIYRLRCVEAWSMVIPWVGFPLANLIKRVEPTGKAKFIEFYTLADSAQMPGVRVPALRWPYIEGLTMDEAMHPLTILAVGLYGEVMPKQDGAPIRLDRAVEVRLQEREVARAHPLRRAPAGQLVAAVAAAGVRVLLQRQPDRRPPALDPGDRAPHWRVLPPEDADVQRLRRTGAGAVRGAGPEEKLLGEVQPFALPGSQCSVRVQVRYWVRGSRFIVQGSGRDEPRTQANDERRTVNAEPNVNTNSRTEN